MIACLFHVSLFSFGYQPDILTGLRANTASAHKLLTAIPGIAVSGVPESPLLHLRVASDVSQAEAQAIVRRVSDYALHKKNVLVSASRYTGAEHVVPAPSVRICISAAHSQKDRMFCAVSICVFVFDAVLQWLRLRTRCVRRSASPCANTTSRPSCPRPPPPPRRTASLSRHRPRSRAPPPSSLPADGRLASKLALGFGSVVL